MSLQVSVAQAVGEHLQSPDDLNKTGLLRKRLAKEKASIDAKLKSGVKDQLDATRDGLKKLFSTRANVQAVKDEMVGIERMGRESTSQIKTFDQINAVSAVHRNFAQTEEIINNLKEMYSRLDVLEAMLAQDARDPTGSHRNLLPLHYQLNQLESFKNQTMHQAKKSSPQTKAKLNEYFARLSQLIEDFDRHIATIAKHVLDLVRAGYPNVVVKLLKIAEMEGKADEKATAIRLMKRAKVDAASKFRSIQAEARVLKLYRPKIVKSIQESIHEKFEGKWADGRNDPVSFIETLDDWIFLDLNWVETDLVPCFPPDYEIYSLYIKRYHKELDILFNRIKNENPPATVLLSMHGWVKVYKKKMKELDIPEELLEPPLMGGKEQSLIEDYARLIVSKLDEWTANLMKDELKDFSSREQAPNQDADGLYEMRGAIIFWQIINEQVDAATESGQGAILARIVTESVRVIKQTQEQWSKLIDSEFKKNVEGKPEDIAPGLAEYLVALANDQIKCADYAEALSARLEPMVSEKYKVVVSEQLNDAIDGYLDVTKKCTQTIIDLMFHDLRPATKQLFQVTWYDGIMPQIVETLRDYMGDYQSTLNPSLLELLIEDLLDTFLIIYLTALSKSSKLRMQGSRDKMSAPDRMKLDVRDSFNFFSTLKPAQELEAYFEIIELILDLLTASKSLAFLSFTQFSDRHGPNLPFVEALLRARDDLDRSSVNEIMESIKRRVKENNLDDPPQPTIMKKINVSSGLSRFLPL